MLGLIKMLSLSTIQKRLSNLKNWALDGSFIVKDFDFNSFKEIGEFVNKIAEIVEKQKHHPSIVINENNLRISLISHEERGLTTRDFDFAEAVDNITGD